jgi:hypothetical protein
MSLTPKRYSYTVLTLLIHSLYIVSAGGVPYTVLIHCTLPLYCQVCFAAVEELPGLANVTVSTTTVDDASLPPGCTVSSIAAAPAVMSSGVDKRGTAAVVYNTNAASKARCGWAAEVVGEANDLVALQLSVTNETVVITIAGAYSLQYSTQ